MSAPRRTCSPTEPSRRIGARDGGFCKSETIKNVDDALLNFMFRMLPPASPPPFLPFVKSTHTHDESAPA